MGQRVWRRSENSFRPPICSRKSRGVSRAATNSHPKTL
ncbi:unnamed protein product [Amoebophrya sp. A25]|nr:unnamed protein product [Amoebophrya sp. A25]|eukprot:GSA25T00021579001.1